MFNFWRTGLASLRKEITLAVIIKLILITVLWYVCFSQPVVKTLTIQSMQQHILGKQPQLTKDSS